MKNDSELKRKLSEIEEYKIKNSLDTTNKNISNLENQIDKYYTKESKYTIQKWDNLYKISKKYEIWINDLLKLNPQIKDKNKIYIWQKINIPDNRIDRSLFSETELKFYDKIIKELNSAKTNKETLEFFIKVKTEMKKEEIKNDLKSKPWYIEYSEKDGIYSYKDNTDLSKHRIHKKEETKKSNTDNKNSSTYYTPPVEGYTYKEDIWENTKLKENIWDHTRAKPFLKYKHWIEEYRKHPAFRWEIPLETVLLLLIHEWSGWNPRIKSGVEKSTSYWLWQINDQTWEEITQNLPKKRYYKWKISVDKDKRFDPEEQIKAMLLYLDFCARRHNCSYQDAIVYYHMWPYVETLNDDNIQEYLKNNPAIRKLIEEDGIDLSNLTVEMYMEYTAKNYRTLEKTG